MSLTTTRLLHWCVLVLFWVGVDTWGTVRPGVSASPSPEELRNQATWVGNAIYHQNPEDLVIAAALRDLYLRTPHFNASDALRMANQLRDEFAIQKQRDLGQSSEIQDVAETLAAIAKTIPHTEKFADLIAKLGSWAQIAHRKTIGAEERIISQIQSYDRFSKLNDFGAVWEDVYQTANVFPEAKLAINAFLVDRLKASTDQNADQILQNNPDYAQFVSQLNLTTSLTESSSSRQQVQDALKSIVSRLETMNQGSIEGQALLQSLAIEARKERADRQAELLTAIRRQQQETELQALRSGVYILSILGGIIDPNLSRPISVFGNSAIQIADSLSKFSSQNATLAGSAILTGNILGAVMSLTSLSGPSEGELLREHLQSLSRQISLLGQQMNDRLNRVDKHLAGLMREMGRGFAQVSFDLGRVQEDITAIQNQLARQHRALGQIGSDLHAQFARSVRSKLLSSVNRCMNGRDYSAHAELRYESYRDCLQEFATYSTEEAQQQVHGPLDPRQLPARSYAELADWLRKAPLEAIAAPLALIAEKSFLSANGSGWSSENEASFPVNPMEWAIGAQAYLDLIAQAPRYHRLTELSGADRILQAGSRIDQTLKGFFSVATREGPKPSHLLSTKILAAYRGATEKLIAAIQSLDERFQRNPENQIPAGINPWAGADQVVARPRWAPLRSTTACRALATPIGPVELPELSIPDELADEMIPASIRNAELLKLAKTSFCYLLTFDPPVDFPKNSSPMNWTPPKTRLSLQLLLKEGTTEIARRTVFSPYFLFPSQTVRAAIYKFQLPHPQRLSAMIGENWQKEWNLVQALRAQPNSALPASLERESEATRLVDARLSDMRAALLFHRRHNEFDRTREFFREVSAIKFLLESYTRLGLPETWLKNDYLRALFSGDEQLFDEDSFDAWQEQRGSAPSILEIAAEFKRRTDALESEMVRAVEASSGTETISTLGPTLRRLRDMKQELIQIVPRVPIDQAVREIEQILAQARSA